MPKYVVPSKATEMARPGITTAPDKDRRTEPVYKGEQVLYYKIPITTERGKRRKNGIVHPDTETRSKPGYKLKTRKKSGGRGPLKGPSKRPKAMHNDDWVKLMTS